MEAIVQNVDSLVTKLEEKKQIIDETIADPTVPDAAKDKRYREMELREKEKGELLPFREKQVRVTDVIDRLKKIRKDYAEVRGNHI